MMRSIRHRIEIIQNHITRYNRIHFAVFAVITIGMLIFSNVYAALIVAYPTWAAAAHIIPPFAVSWLLHAPYFNFFNILFNNLALTVFSFILAAQFMMLDPDQDRLRRLEPPSPLGSTAFVITFILSYLVYSIFLSDGIGLFSIMVAGITLYNSIPPNNFWSRESASNSSTIRMGGVNVSLAPIPSVTSVFNLNHSQQSENHLTSNNSSSMSADLLAALGSDEDTHEQEAAFESPVTTSAHEATSNHNESENEEREEEQNEEGNENEGEEAAGSEFRF